MTTSSPSSSPEGRPFLSIIIPAYNEERRIIPTLERIACYLEQQSYAADVVVVDDGSQDLTAFLVEEFAQQHPNVFLLKIPHRGKGHAVKVGMLASRGEYRFLCDADLSMPIEELSRFLNSKTADYDIAIGSREALGAHRYDEPTYRHLIGRLFNLFVRLVAVKGIQDTQCGFKCFRAEVAERLFPLQTLDGFGFDVEVLFLAQRRNYRILEIPVDWYHATHSKVSPLRDSFRVFRDTLIVRWNQWRGRYAE